MKYFYLLFTVAASQSCDVNMPYQRRTFFPHLYEGDCSTQAKSLTIIMGQRKCSKRWVNWHKLRRVMLAEMNIIKEKIPVLYIVNNKNLILKYSNSGLYRYQLICNFHKRRSWARYVKLKKFTSVLLKFVDKFQIFLKYLQWTNNKSVFYHK